MHSTPFLFLVSALIFSAFQHHLPINGFERACCLWESCDVERWSCWRGVILEVCCVWWHKRFVSMICLLQHLRLQWSMWQGCPSRWRWLLPSDFLYKVCGPLIMRVSLFQWADGCRCWISYLGSLFWSLSCLLVEERLHLFLFLWTLAASVSECHTVEETGHAVSHCLGLCTIEDISPLNPLSRKDVLCKNIWKYLWSPLALLIFQTPVRGSFLRCQVEGFKCNSSNLSQLCSSAYAW